jgi:DGQHR domain-containing protein
MKVKSGIHNKAALLSFPVLVGSCLGHKAYRGFGSLADIARISRADIFDQDQNRSGTQRNLSLAHARQAHQYVRNTEKAFYPEMILNIRDKSYIKFTQKDSEGDAEFGILSFVKDPAATEKIVISRLDGNHRLWFADGHQKGLDPIERPVSFCILTLPNLDTELELFRDINDNQMGMNTSHLQNITARLLGDKALKVQKPALYIVQRLLKEKTSPLNGMVHEGGKAHKKATLSGLTIANLTSSVSDMLARSAKLAQFPDADAQYKVIENYWKAVKKWLPKAWSNPKDYLIFKGVGLYAISYVGIAVIDRALLKGKFSTNDMLHYLKQMPPESLLKGQTLPYAGRGGGRKLANDLISNLGEDGEVSLSALQKMILAES